MHLTLHNKKDEPSFALPHWFQQGLKLAIFPLQVTTVTPPEFTVDLIILQWAFFGTAYSSAHSCFQGHWLLGNKSAEISYLNDALHSQIKFQ